MLRITAKLHLHFFTLILAAICFFEGKLIIFALTYFTMLLHELSHYYFAKLIGLQTECIALYPFGVNLKLKNKMVHSFADECILYLAGPLSNAVMALIFLLIYTFNKSYIIQYLYVSNTALMIVNLLPIIPLDGGILLKKIISHFTNERTSTKVINIISLFFVFLLIAFFIYSAILTEYNFSILLLSVFLIGNLFVQKEKYDVDFVKELMFYSKKKKNKINHIITKTQNINDIIHKFHKSKYNIIYCTDNDGHIVRTLTEEEVLRSVLEYI